MRRERGAEVVAGPPTPPGTATGATDRPEGRGVLTLMAGVAAVVAAACFSEDPDPTAPLPAECRQLALDAGVDPDAADVEVVGIRDFGFVPDDITVREGTRVFWVNCEPPNTPEHTSTSDGGVWNSPLLDRGDTFDRLFEPGEEGTYPYHCVPHPFMEGTVTVVPRPIPG